VAEHDIESLDFCGLDGDADDPPTRRELNHFFKRVLISHVKPVKRKVSEVHIAMFDPQHGLIPALQTLRTLRRWIVLAAAWCATVILGGLTVISKLREMGWFF
jgi:hypothetical protein